jgi:hypothetical protein
MKVEVGEPKTVPENEARFMGAYFRFIKHYESLHNNECVIQHGERLIGLLKEFAITIYVLDINNVPEVVKEIPKNYEGYKVCLEQWIFPNN